MIFGEGVDTEAGTYTVFEEIELSASCPCGRTLRVVVAKKFEEDGQASLRDLQKAHRQACELTGTSRDPLGLSARVKTVTSERKVTWTEPTAISAPLASPSEAADAALHAKPEAPFADLKGGRGE